jgi:hypothetical protein
VELWQYTFGEGAVAQVPILMPASSASILCKVEVATRRRFAMLAWISWRRPCRLTRFIRPRFVLVTRRSRSVSVKRSRTPSAESKWQHHVALLFVEAGAAPHVWLPPIEAYGGQANKHRIKRAQEGVLKGGGTRVKAPAILCCGTTR